MSLPSAIITTIFVLFNGLYLIWRLTISIKYFFIILVLYLSLVVGHCEYSVLIRIIPRHRNFAHIPLDLIQLTFILSSTKTNLNCLLPSFKEARMQLEQYRQDRTRWQKESRKAHVRLGEGDTVAETEKESIRKAIQDGRQDQKKILLSALAIRMESMSISISRVFS